MAVITLPLVMLLVIGKEAPLDNEKEAEFETPTVSTWFSGGFQGKFEAWFSTHYPSRGNFVLFYKQFKYDLDSLNIISIASGKESEEINLLKSDEEVWQFMFDTDLNELYSIINIRRRDELPVGCRPADLQPRLR